MVDKLEWTNEASETPRTWHLMDRRDVNAPDMRAVIYIDLLGEVIFYPIYRSAIRIKLPKPEDMSIGQLKDWTLNQFLLLRES